MGLFENLREPDTISPKRCYPQKEEGRNRSVLT